jgi:hypothetical protein
MDYDKLIVVDFDDTLCLHSDDKSNIAGGTPNVRLINRLNDLHAKGYLIHIYTARGHLSAPSRSEADKKYRPVINEWLKKHNVKYDRLDFNKPFGIIYIDDKAVRPFELHLLEGL